MQLTVIQQKICEIRGQHVMMDYDPAELYQIDTRQLKESVRRNRKRFPEGFMTALTKRGIRCFTVAICDLKAFPCY
ncbi:ORF6N domain-containing protein [Niabella beijingensis]|uniref:ORF6N domain-containing protein n=1 Tax=Niabella beijingensis TaxID=2872700 RepID=UPI001CBDE026